MATTSKPTFHRFTIGDYECFSISDGGLDLDATQTFQGASPLELTDGLNRYPQISCFTRDNTPFIKDCPLNFLIIKGEDQTILIDTGYGDLTESREQPAGKLLENAGKAGLRTEDIDKVIITHWHTDHFGGTATKDGRVLFPNAEYILSKVETNHIRGTVKDWALGRLNAIESRTIVYDGEYRVNPDIKILTAYGHTPGHIVVDLQSNGQRLLQVADVIVHYLNLERPEWTMAWEWDGAMASRVRVKLIEEAYRSGCLLHACHMPFPGLGRITRIDGAYRWVDDFN